MCSISRDRSRSRIKTCADRNQNWDSSHKLWYLSHSDTGIKSGIASQTAAEGLSDNTTDCACYATARASDTTILKPPFSNRYEAAVRKTITRLGRAGESNHSPCVERKWHPCKIEIAWGYRACPSQRMCPSATHTVPPLSMQVLRHPSHAARAEQPAAGVDRTRARRLQPVQDRPRRCQRLPPRPAVGPCSTGGLRVTTGRMCRRRCLRR